MRLVQKTRSDHWGVTAAVTHIVIGLFPFKIGIVRSSFPVAAKRPQEHLSFMEVVGRYLLRALDAQRWFFPVLFGGYGLLHGWLMAVARARMRWWLICSVLAVWFLLMLTITKGGRLLMAMEGDPCPVGS